MYDVSFYGMAWADCLLAVGDCDLCLLTLAPDAWWAGGTPLPSSAAVPCVFHVVFCVSFLPEISFSEQQPQANKVGCS